MDYESIQHMRDNAAAELARGRAAYHAAEKDLHELDRRLCMLAGMVQAYDLVLIIGREEGRSAERGFGGGDSHPVGAGMNGAVNR